MSTDRILVVHEAGHLIAGHRQHLNMAASWVELDEYGNGAGGIQAPLDHPDHPAALLVAMLAGREAAVMAGQDQRAADRSAGPDLERAAALAEQVRPSDPTAAIRDARRQARELVEADWEAVNRLADALAERGRLAHAFLASAVGWAVTPGSDRTFGERLDRNVQARQWYEWCVETFGNELVPVQGTGRPAALERVTDRRLVHVAETLAARETEAPRPRWMGGDGRLPASYRGSGGQPDDPLGALLDDIEVAEEIAGELQARQRIHAERQREVDRRFIETGWATPETIHGQIYSPSPEALASVLEQAPEAPEVSA